MEFEGVKAEAQSDAVVIRGSSQCESVDLVGIYTAECFGPDGQLKWSDRFENSIMNSGRNLALDAFLAGAPYTVVGPFMGLISAVGFSAYAIGDTMTSHAGWTEAGIANPPTYTGPRKNLSTKWSAAASGGKALTVAESFAITNPTNVVVKGVFLVFGAGAVSTIDNTAGTLFSAGNFTGGDKTVGNGEYCRLLAA